MHHRKGIRAGVAASFVVVLLLCGSAFGDCPPGSAQVGLERNGDEEITLCKCLPGFVARGNQCVPKLPVADPAFFVSREHSEFIAKELKTLRSRQERLEKQLKGLDKLREEQNEYLQQMGELREQVVYDAVGDLLGVVSTTELLTKIPRVSLQTADDVADVAKAFKASVEALASMQAGPDRERARDKAIEAHQTSLSQLAKLAAPIKEKEALSKVIDASFEAIKASNANQKAADKPLVERVATALDGLAAIAGTVYAPLGAARSSVHATGGAIVLWKIQQDKESLVNALVSVQRARLAADQRLAATREMIKFYEIELQKAGKE